MEKMPELADAARENRAFLIRVCRFLATNVGITQFLDCGSGLPTAENVHQVARRINADSKVVYTDYDPIVAAHGRALLEENDRTRYVQADIYERKASSSTTSYDRTWTGASRSQFCSSRPCTTTRRTAAGLLKSRRSS